MVYKTAAVDENRRLWNHLKRKLECSCFYDKIRESSNREEMFQDGRIFAEDERNIMRNA